MCNEAHAYSRGPVLPTLVLMRNKTTDIARSMSTTRAKTPSKFHEFRCNLTGRGWPGPARHDPARPGQVMSSLGSRKSCCRCWRTVSLIHWLLEYGCRVQNCPAQCCPPRGPSRPDVWRSDQWKVRAVHQQRARERDHQIIRSAREVRSAAYLAVEFL